MLCSETLILPLSHRTAWTPVPGTHRGDSRNIATWLDHQLRPTKVARFSHLINHHSMPRLRLPPLPPPTTWNNHFSRAKLAHAPDPSIHRNFPRRVTLTNRKLADEFVRALKIRPGEVIIETFGGAGQLTRSLLNGGNPENTVETAARWVKDKRDAETSKEPIKSDLVDFPTWRDELERHEPPSSEPLENVLPRPHIVVADEPSTDFLVRGLGMPQSQVPTLLSRASVNPRGFKYPLGPGRSADIEGGHILESIALEQDPYPTEVYQSTIEPNLFFSPSTPYPWTTIPRILSHELVSSRLEKYNEEVKRPWSAPPPPITIVGQMPTSVIGDQLVAQWLTSVIGASFNGSTWIWDWGRIRFALIVPKNLYDVIVSYRLFESR